ncbi:hypothetical protein BDF20DRAFT_814272 [Mycotypha africana]|uniref:uncharacterized protein n=1 Tax=Mycotypha africana TaxID=64632 RepID=UPI002301A90C|nr:uncharacterized protein BDF20DRAFT_814272 [Mycotypha africana]KAI8987516.1 hypothetical protein BDF20DRAFT_814272 [Mycotypha africana]
MQSVEAATALYWNPDELAKQIAIVDSQLYNEVSVGKHSLLSIATSATPTSMLEATKLKHLLDFQHYLSHSFAHQIIYWIHLVNTFNPSATTSTTAAAVIPPVVNPQHLNKENLLTHLIRVAYLLLHAYYDFSGFAAIMKALTFPEVRRLFHNTTGGNNDNKKQLSIWEHTSSRTKDMFRDLVSIISSENNYQAYYRTLRTKLLEQQLKQQSLQSQQQQQEQAYNGTTAIMIAVPWFEPHLSKIKSIVNSYKAGDNVQSEDRFLSSLLVVLSAPGAHKLDMEVSILELSQHNSCSSNLSLEEILNKRNSLSPTAVGAKTIHIEGLRAAILTTSNLHSLAPGKQLIHHWLVSRVYLTKEQLINESTEVEPLRLGERPLSPAPSSCNSASMGKDDLTEDTDLKEVELKEMVPKDDLKKEEQEAGHKDSEQLQKESQPTSESILSHPSTTVSKPKSSLSPTAPEFIPHQHKSTTTISTISTETSEEIWLGYPTQEEGEESERWGGYPIPSNETDEDEVWKGYPGPNSSTDSPRRASSQSETSEEWKGYHATKMEADWQRESALKVQEHEWQGYTLETLDEDELDSSTMMNGEFEKSRQARHEKQNLYETQRRGRRHI